MPKYRITLHVNDRPNHDREYEVAAPNIDRAQSMADWKAADYEDRLRREIYPDADDAMWVDGYAEPVEEAKS